MVAMHEWNRMVVMRNGQTDMVDYRLGTLDDQFGKRCLGIVVKRNLCQNVWG